MVDATDFATPESALSAATKIKIYGQLRSATGTNFVSSGTGSLTNDITHVGASVTGQYHIALANADISDASAAFYDTYVISLSATGAAFQTLIVEGVSMESYASAVLSDLNSRVTAVMPTSAIVSDLYSMLSDLLSDFQSRVPKAVATQSLLSDLHSDLRSVLVVMSGVQSDLYSALSDFQSDFASRVPKAVATQSQLSDLHSDLRSVLVVMSGVLSDAYSMLVVQSDAVSDVLSRLNSASFLSDIASHVWAAKYTANSAASSFGSLLSDIYSRAGGAVTASDISDIASAVWATALATKLVQLNTSDLSDLRSAIAAGPAATVTPSDISDIASAVADVLASRLSDILSAATQTNSRVLLAQSAASDAASGVTVLLSRVTKAVATNSQLSDLASDLRSYLTVMSGVQSDLYSALSDFQSDFGSRVPKRVATDSQLSDLHSDLRSHMSGLSGIKKNVAMPNFKFLMTDSTNHAPMTGLTVTVTRAIDAGAFAAGTLSAVTEVAFGMYRVDFAASDLNGDNITFRATAAGADDLLLTIETDP
jgi:hypothetical protein